MSDLTDAQFRLGGGYYNNGALSPSNPGGFANDGHETNLFSVNRDIVIIGQGASTAADLAVAKAAEAQGWAATALGAPGTLATSSTNRAIPASVGGSLTFTLDQTGKAFGLGQTALFASTASPVNQLAGPITAFNPATGVMTILVQFIAGAGTFAAWTVGLSTPVDGTLTGRVAALETANVKQKGRARLLFKELL